MAKYKSIVGVPFASYVDGQLAERQKIISSRDRNSQQLRWLSNRVGWYRMSSGAIDTVDGENLAKNNILQGGTVGLNKENKISLRKGFDQTYIPQATDKVGFKPMVGITDFSVTTGGRWQTLLQAEVSFTVYSLDQLDIFSRLYMSLGVHVFLEWGHTPYVANNGKIQKL